MEDNHDVINFLSHNSVVVIKTCWLCRQWLGKSARMTQDSFWNIVFRFQIAYNGMELCM
jgi:hypothetical protein